jgi:hypothetical protein
MGMAPLVPATPIWTLSYVIDDDEFDDRSTYVHSLSAGTVVYLSNASDTMDLELHGGLEFDFGKGEIDGLHPFADLLFQADLLRGTISQEFNYWTYSYFAYDDPDEYAVSLFRYFRSDTAYAFPVSRYGDLAFGHSYFLRHIEETYYLKEEGWVYSESGEPSLEVWNDPLVGRHEAFVSISRSKWDSTYDPAYLGRTGSLLRFSVTGILNRYYNPDIFPMDPKYDPSTVLELNGRVKGTILSPGRKMSLTGQVRGIGYLQTEIPEQTPHYLYLSLGRQGYATGYDYFYPAVYFVQGELDLRINPFHNPFDSVRWYERLSLGVRAEGGIVFTLDSGTLEYGYPLSVELALRGGILVTPKREAYLYCKVAFPFTDKEFFGTEWSNRVYFGFSL